MTNYSTNFFFPSFDAWSSVSSPAGSSVPQRLNNLKATKASAPPKWDHLFNESIAEVFNAAHKERMRKEADPETYFSKYISEGNGIITDLLSIVRNSTSATALFKGAEATAKVATPVAGMAVAGGAMTSFSGLNGMRKAGENLYQDYQHENLEGGFVHGTQGLQSMSLATLGGSMVASNAAVLAGAGAVAAGATMGIVVSGFAMLLEIGFARAPWPWHLMAAAGLVMTGVFASIWFGPWRALQQAVAAGSWAVGAQALNRIRQRVTFNLALGAFTVLLATLGLAF